VDAGVGVWNGGREGGEDRTEDKSYWVYGEEVEFESCGEEG